jgi:WD40 repeat protein
MGAGGSATQTVEVIPSGANTQQSSASTHGIGLGSERRPCSTSSASTAGAERGAVGILSGRPGVFFDDRASAGSWQFQSAGAVNIYENWTDFEEAANSRLEEAYVDGKPQCQLVIQGRMVTADFQQLVLLRAHGSFHCSHGSGVYGHQSNQSSSGASTSGSGYGGNGMQERIRRVQRGSNNGSSSSATFSGLGRSGTYFFSDPFSDGPKPVGGQHNPGGGLRGEDDHDDASNDALLESKSLGNVALTNTTMQIHSEGTIRAATQQKLVVLKPKLLYTIKAHEEPIYSLSVDPSGSKVLSGSKDGTLRLWEVPTGFVMQEFEQTPGQVISVSLSKTKSLAISGSDDDKVRLYHLNQKTPAAVLEGHSHKVYGVVFAADSRTALSASMDGTFRQWDLTAQCCIRSIHAHSQPVFSVAAGPRSSWLVLSASDDNLAKVHDLRLHQQRSVVATLRGHAKTLWGCDIRYDELEAATCGMDKRIMLWDLRFLNTALPSNSSTGSDSPGESNSAFGGRPHTTSISPPPAPIALDPSTKSNTSPHTGTPPSATSGPAASITSPVDPAGGLSKRPVQTLGIHQKAIHWVEYAPDGNSVFSCSRDLTWKLTGTKYGHELMSADAHAGNVFRVCYNAVSNQVFTCSSDKTVKVWEVESSVFTREAEAFQDSDDDP